MTVVPLAQGEFFQRLALAIGLGLMIGFERQWRQRTAGLHTTALVCIGAALFTALPDLLGSTDTMRVAAQVVTGVGFLAGGVILREGFNVRGLVTAATLWATAAVGALAGTGLELQAMVAGAVVLVVNLVCLPLATVISRIPRGGFENLETSYTVHVGCAEGSRTAVRELVLSDVHMTSLTLTAMSSSVPVNGSVQVTAQMSKSGREDGTVGRLQAVLEKIPGVASVSWEATEQST